MTDKQEKWHYPNGCNKEEWEKAVADREFWTLPPEEQKKRDRRGQIFGVCVFLIYPAYLAYEWFSSHFLYIGP